MEDLQSEISDKRAKFRELTGELKSYTIHIQDDLQKDQQQLRKVAVAYEHSDGLLRKANNSLDRALAQGEVRTSIYVAGALIICTVLTWKFLL